MNKSRKQLFFSDFMKKRFLPTCFMASLVVANAYAENNFLLNQEGYEVSVPMSMQQSKQLTGIVMDVNNVPIIGANIRIKGTSVGTITDFDGKFSLSCTPKTNIQISYIGYQTTEFIVGNNESMTIVLKEDLQNLEEVVVVGFGTQKKVNLTGSVSTVGAKELQGVPATNVASMMQGKMPGVTISQGSGQPGRENNSIRIRGVGTMNNSDPMVLVDGLESSMNDVNPNDIESISVLKDAAAASIYGTRAANGVILITTKRGKEGKMNVSYNGYIGFQQPVRTFQQLSSAQYAELLNEGKMNEGLAPVYTPKDIEKYRNGSDLDNFPNTDWLDLLYQGSGRTHNHNLSVSGGTEAARYAVSLAYYNQEGLIKNADHDRYNVRINLDSKVNNWLKFGVNSSLSRRDIVVPTNPFSNNIGQIFRQANRIPNTYVNMYSDGTYGRHIDGNPIAWIEAGGKATSRYSHVLGSVFGEVQLMEGLTFRGVAGIDYNLDDGKTHIKEISYGDGSVQGPNSVEDYLERNMTVTLQAMLNYEKKIKKHTLKAMFGVSRESYTHNITKAYRKNFPSNDLPELDAGSSNGWSNVGRSIDARIGSYFGRINYDYEGKYLLEANVRSDGSSKFSTDNRWGTFPSFSAGWRISEEKFMKNINWLSNLKLRGSWGKLGNHRIDDYQYLAMIALGEKYNFANEVADGAAQTKANNINLTWETTTELDLGIDADIKNGLISFGFDYYDRYTDDILTSVPVSLLFGLDAPVSNAGAMRNKGVELSLAHRYHIGKIEYNISGYTAFNKNKVEKYLNPSKSTKIRMEGEAWDSYYGYECIGIFQSDDEAKNSATHSAHVKAGDLKFKDQNGDGTINAEDRVVLGNPIPSITYGFNLDLKYRNFDFSASFQGVADVYHAVDRESMWGFIDGANAQEKHLDRTIVKDGVVVKQGHYPRTLISQSHNREMSSFLAMNASYLRLKNIQLGYNLPNVWMKKLQINRARVYLSGQNLLTFSKFPDDFDPEGGSGTTYPQVAIYTFGLDITF
jgi:TonB-linked SusC/RagA family outer membrane protein